MDLVLTKFDDDDMYDTMKLMQSTDLFMGMHGAGFTNLLFMPPVCVWSKHCPGQGLSGSGPGCKVLCRDSRVGSSATAGFS